MKHKGIILSISILLVLFLVSGFYLVQRTKSQMKELFSLNKQLQEEGYYMAEFEFKMLGIAYDLDKGHYYTSLARINQLHQQLKTKQGLIKMPKFQSSEEELAFYLNLQNPQTGSFMDASYPFWTYTGPTGNVLLHLQALAEASRQPLQLKYPLKYLDAINSPRQMKAYLDEVATVGWIAAKFPQTSFHFARDMLSLFYEENTVGKYHLYNLTPETSKTVLQWFYENQDPKTGLWGPKSKNGKLQKIDTSNTVSILKVFVKEDGRDIYAEFPLRYQDELSASILQELAKPVPQDDDLDEWHEWNLKTSKSINALTRYLWDDISVRNKGKTQDFIEYYLKIKFEKFYLAEEGAFSYYPQGAHATIDGTNEYAMFSKIGAFSAERQARLWGTPEDNITDLGVCKLSNPQDLDFDKMAKSKSVNSLRLYKMSPDYLNLTSGVAAIVYPQKTPVLDVVDLIPRLKHRINSTVQT